MAAGAAKWFCGLSLAAVLGISNASVEQPHAEGCKRVIQQAIEDGVVVGRLTAMRLDVDEVRWRSARDSYRRRLSFAARCDSVQERTDQQAAAVSMQSVRKLSVMSYNVHGLPWPLAKPRAAALKAIGNRLKSMRSQGDEPTIVLLQEAFTHDAKSIWRIAGYPYFATGPSRYDQTDRGVPASALSFVRASQKLKGEGDGKLADSGLLLLSN